jgi:hypothetical protein
VDSETRKKEASRLIANGYSASLMIPKPGGCSMQVNVMTQLLWKRALREVVLAHGRDTDILPAVFKKRQMDVTQ